LQAIVVDASCVLALSVEVAKLFDLGVGHGSVCCGVSPLTCESYNMPLPLRKGTSCGIECVLEEEGGVVGG
jgi:hypothetical protein